MRTKYMIWDLETQNISTYGRFCNPFDPINYIVARGWKVQGDAKNSYQYIRKPKVTVTTVPDDVLILVGHNIKFDLLYEWEHIKQTFLSKGGLIWDTQLAEYLLQGQQAEFMMNSLDQLAPMYGGSTKLDIVKQMWDNGAKTSEIPESLLIDYLIGEQPDCSGGDIGNTEKIFTGQVKRAREQGQMRMILARMEALLCTTEMEYNGLYVDYQAGLSRAEELRAELQYIQQQLQENLPVLPDGFEFNWNSRAHLSALLFGGAVKYTRREQLVKDGVPQFRSVVEEYTDGKFKSGLRKGQDIIRKRKVPGPEPILRLKEYIFRFPGFVKGKQKDIMGSVDADGNPMYSTSSDVIESLRGSGIEFVDLLVKRADISKDLGTYYIQTDTKGVSKGMLTCVNPDGRIHHSLNHTSTVTTRLSSTEPNLQNIPREDTSDVKKMFKSRFADGRMLELDYQTLEIVGQAWLSGDTNLIQDIISGIDMHCKRVAAQYGIEYSDALFWCKKEEAPDHELWKHRRTKAKAFSFQRAFGAGAKKIAASTGMSVDDVKTLIAAEEAMYPDLVKYNANVHAEVEKNSVPFRDATGKVYHKSYYVSPTSTRYSFRTWDAPDFLQERGILDSYKPTEEKNYPVQGTSGEFVQLALGKLFRWFLGNQNYGGKALLVNTVHDCVWADTCSDIHATVAKDMKRIMEGIPQYIKEVYNLPCPVPFRVSMEAGINLFNKTTLKD